MGDISKYEEILDLFNEHGTYPKNASFRLKTVKDFMEFVALRKQKPASCLNDIFDAIFVISIKTRIETLSITLQQLHDESIDYILWEGHSDYNPQSNELFDAFTKEWCPNSEHMDKNTFFLRQTQLDILKYSKKNNLNKILLLEDDIVLANPWIIKAFCTVEHKLPNWDVLGLGVNQQNEAKNKIKMIPISLCTQCTRMKYHYRSIESCGSFGLAFSSKAYDNLLNTLDYKSNGQCTDLFCAKSTTKNMIGINLFPTLIMSEDQIDWMERNTLGEHIKFFMEYIHCHDGEVDPSCKQLDLFTKYFDWRFSNETDIEYDYTKIEALFNTKQYHIK